jgi:hypothetical protein
LTGAAADLTGAGSAAALFAGGLSAAVGWHPATNNKLNSSQRQ